MHTLSFMNRRLWLQGATGVTLSWLAPQVLAGAVPPADRVLILIELKGGNDGLNTVVPYASDAYYRLRGSLAVRPEDVLRVDGQVGLHPELKALVPMWAQQELAIVQGVGYPSPNLSHFRSIEIWERGSPSHETLDSGWVTRAMNAGYAGTRRFTAEGVLIGRNDFGPLTGARAVTLNNTETFVNQARMASPHAVAGNAALQHLLQVESHISQAAEGLRAQRHDFTTVFPQGAFGNAVRTAAQVVASQRENLAAGRGGIPVITLSLGSFDTHQNQLGTHANLLRQLAEGMAALQAALIELGAWERSLIMTFSEFGRRPRPNNSQGTDHGTAAPHFVAGGMVRGGLYGQHPSLDVLDATQNLVHTVDFRQLYATIATQWWGVAPQAVVRGQFAPVNFLRT